MTTKYNHLSIITKMLSKQKDVTWTTWKVIKYFFMNYLITKNEVTGKAAALHVCEAGTMKCFYMKIYLSK